jgi:hypothetical protein
MNYINDNLWNRSQHIIRRQPIPIVATLDLTDPYTKYYYLHQAQLTGTTACMITIGITRQLGTGNAQPPVGTSENGPNP